MKRFVSVLALTLMWPILRAPAWAQLTTLGVGGIAAAVIGTLITPSIVPQPSSYFNQNGPNGFTNNGLQTNGGTVGAMQLPSTTPNNSIVAYVEGQIDPSMTYYESVENALVFRRGRASASLPSAWAIHSFSFRTSCPIAPARNGGMPSRLTQVLSTH